MSKELTFMDVPVTDAGKGIFKVSKSDQGKILDSFGITKEVRKQQQTADSEIAKAALDFVGDKVVGSKEPATLVLGTGDSKTTFNMGTVRTSRNPTGGDPVTTYGPFSIRKKGVVPTSLKSNELKSWQEKVEAAIK